MSIFLACGALAACIMFNAWVIEMVDESLARRSQLWRRLPWLRMLVLAVVLGICVAVTGAAWGDAASHAIKEGYRV